MKKPEKERTPLWALILALGVFGAAARAQTIDWDGHADADPDPDNTGATLLWTTGNNWVGDAVPTSSNSVNFPTIDGGVTVDLDGDKTIVELFLSTIENRVDWSLGTVGTADSLTVTSGSVVVNGKTRPTINANLILGSGPTPSGSIRDEQNIDSMVINGDIIGAGGSAVDLQIGSSGSQDSITVNGNITANNLTIGQTGDDGGAILTGNNTVNGTVTVNGILGIKNSNALGGAGGTVENGGRVDFLSGAQGVDLSLFTFKSGTVLGIDADPGPTTQAPTMADNSSITVGRTSVDTAFDVNFEGSLRVDGQNFGGGGDFDGDFILTGAAPGTTHVLSLENTRRQNYGNSTGSTYDGLISEGVSGETLEVHLVGEGGPIELTNPGNDYSGGTTVTRGDLILNVAGAIGTGDLTVDPATDLSTTMQRGPNNDNGGSVNVEVARVTLNADDLLDDGLILSLFSKTGDFDNDGLTPDETIFGTVNLNFSGIDTIAALNLDGVSQGAGTYDASTNPDWFTGTGQIQVIPEPGTLALLGVFGLALLATRARRRR